MRERQLLSIIRRHLEHRKKLARCRDAGQWPDQEKVAESVSLYPGKHHDVSILFLMAAVHEEIEALAAIIEAWERCGVEGKFNSEARQLRRNMVRLMSARDKLYEVPGEKRAMYDEARDSFLAALEAQERRDPGFIGRVS